MSHCSKVSIMNKSILTAVAIGAALALWMLSGQFVARSGAPAPAAAPERAAEPMKVRVQELLAQPVNREAIVQGQLEPRRTLELRAETSGAVTAIPVRKGQRVRRDAPLLQLAMEDREARLRQTEALVRQRETDLKAVRTLKQKGLQAESRLIESETLLAAARAELAAVEMDIEHTQIVAPLAGVINELPVEVGEFIERGDPVATLVDDDVLLATAQAPQQSIARLQLGQTVKVQTITGQTLEGKITFISAMADARTRSFRVEAEIPNPEGRLTGGMSAVLRIPLETADGHFVSPSVLVLDDQGALGVKGVDRDNKVVFHPVRIVRTTAGGVWITGLPERVQLITLGQGFVGPGEVVAPVMEKTARAVHGS
jgi:multidrug efflux system membrane fusion protein